MSRELEPNPPTRHFPSRRAEKSTGSPSSPASPPAELDSYWEQEAEGQANHPAPPSGRSARRKAKRKSAR